MTTLIGHRFAPTQPLWFRIYGILFITLGILWALYWGASHQHHRLDIPPAGILVGLGAGFLSRSRLLVLSSSALLALIGIVFAIIARPYQGPSEIASIFGVIIVCLFPVILCMRQWRTLP